MTDEDLGKRLLQLDASERSGTGNAHDQTERILARDRHRMRWLTVTTILTWMLAAGCIGYMIYAYFQLYLPREIMTREEAREAEERGEEIDERWKVSMLLNRVVAIGVVGVTIALGVLALASLCTIFLVMASRRSTLRQINASLIAISEQLRALEGGEA